MAHRLWGWLPVPVRHVAVIPLRADGSMPAGRCVSTWRGPVVEIREAYRDDVGLLAHELRHARQWWLTLGWSHALYRWCPWVRLRMEAAAYAVQLGLAAPVQQPRRRLQYIDFMRRWYRLDRYPVERIAAALDAAFARLQGRG